MEPIEQTLYRHRLYWQARKLMEELLKLCVQENVGIDPNIRLYRLYQQAYQRMTRRHTAYRLAIYGPQEQEPGNGS